MSYRPTLVVALAAVVCFLACLGLIGYQMLPGVASRHLPVKQIRALGFSDVEGRITRIGPFQGPDPPSERPADEGPRRTHGTPRAGPAENGLAIRDQWNRGRSTLNQQVRV